MDAKLRCFLQRTEWALLSLEPGSLVPKVDVGGTNEVECTNLQKLAEPTRGGGGFRKYGTPDIDPQITRFDSLTYNKDPNKVPPQISETPR